MYARGVLGATKSVPFREVSSIQGCPYRVYFHESRGAEASASQTKQHNQDNTFFKGKRSMHTEG